MFLWHLQISNLNLMLAKLKYFFRFSIRFTGLNVTTKTFRATVPAFRPEILVSKLIYIQKFAHAQKWHFWVNSQIVFWLFPYICLQFYSRQETASSVWSGEGRWGFYVTLPSQIYSSSLRDYIDNSVRSFLMLSKT